MTTKHWYLGTHDFFDGLPAEKAEFKSLATRRHMRANRRIFDQGEPADSAYYLESGSVEILRTSPWGKDCIVFMRAAGDMFGLAEVVGEGIKKRECSARTLSPTVLYQISKEDLCLLLSKHHPVAVRVMEVLGGRIRYLSEQIENLMACDVTTRLVKMLVYLSYPNLMDECREDWPVDIPVRLSQQQMAAMIGSCQQTVSEALGRLEREGVIRVSRRTIQVLKRTEVLSYLANEG